MNFIALAEILEIPKILEIPEIPKISKIPKISRVPKRSDEVNIRRRLRYCSSKLEIVN